MLTQVPWPIFVANFSPFAPCCNSVIRDDSCLLTVGNDGSECSVSENTILIETRDASATESVNIPTLNSVSFRDKSTTWFDLVVSIDNNESVKYERMSSEGSTADGSVGVSKSKILLELENEKAWQPSIELWNCDFYLYQRAFPKT